MTMIRVIVTKRGLANWTAEIESRPELKGYGDSECEAIGNLIINHKFRFHIELIEGQPLVCDTQGP